MKLIGSPTSPFVRKCVVALKELGLDGSSIGGLAGGAANQIDGSDDKSLVEVLTDVAEQVQEAEARLGNDGDDESDVAAE